MAKDVTLHLATDDDTACLGQWLARGLGAGDVVLLDGPIGAGKTHLARALIRARLGHDEDIPSPTFTLVQSYAADIEIWHADLYRLSHPDEVRELGLEAAFASALCLVEWPDRLGFIPDNVLRITLAAEGDSRRATLHGPAHTALLDLLAADWPRLALSTAFLARAGWGGARRRYLAGDASDRRYDRLVQGAETAVLMDAPPGKGDDPASFLAIARHLTGLGLSAPKALAEDLAGGFLLLEDLGDDLFARLVAHDPACEPQLYTAATDVLLRLQSHPPANGLPNLTAQGWAEAAAFAFDWYRFAITGVRIDTGLFIATLTDLLHRHADGPRVMILRDYHAENLLWLPDRQGLARVGLLDFQLAQLGQPGYDLVSLLQDARRDVPQALETAMIQRFAAANGQDPARFAAAYAVLGAQRALRILGIFARLCVVAGKPGYLPLLPRVWGQLQRNLAHPALSPLVPHCAALPPPTQETLQRIAEQCPAR